MIFSFESVDLSFDEDGNIDATSAVDIAEGFSTPVKRKRKLPRPKFDLEKRAQEDVTKPYEFESLRPTTQYIKPKRFRSRTPGYSFNSFQLEKSIQIYQKNAFRQKSEQPRLEKNTNEKKNMCLKKTFKINSLEKDRRIRILEQYLKLKELKNR
eukprot:snap_masked-scaffold_11-processed-gene-5.17-mRNA-1 protein AED:1.00 eAED:1.00 QI:0/-1/0/0/-1/1/1/0/153